MRCRPGIVRNSKYWAVPDKRCTTRARSRGCQRRASIVARSRCTAPGTHRARTASERHAGRPHHHADGLLLEAGLVGLDDLVEAGNVLDVAGEPDLHDLARLADDLVAGLVPPLAGGIEYGEAV